MNDLSSVVELIIYTGVSGFECGSRSHGRTVQQFFWITAHVCTCQIIGIEITSMACPGFAG